MKDQLATTGCRIDVLCEGFKSDTTLSKVSDSVDKVAKSAPEPVKTPDNECVTFSKKLFGKRLNTTSTLHFC
jgi:hypothetical protein